MKITTVSTRRRRSDKNQSGGGGAGGDSRYTMMAIDRNEDRKLNLAILLKIVSIPRPAPLERATIRATRTTALLARLNCTARVLHCCSASTYKHVSYNARGANIGKLFHGSQPPSPYTFFFTRVKGEKSHFEKISREEGKEKEKKRRERVACRACCNQRSSEHEARRKNL